MSRTGKFYYKNEKSLMESLGLKQVPGSGNGWIHKEDGENENIICQLKSTDKKSMAIKKLDIDKLNYNANVSHKIPLFVIEFLETNEIYFLVSPLDIPEVAQYIEIGKNKKKKDEEYIETSFKKRKKVRKIKSDDKSREKFWEEYKNAYKK